MNARRWSCALFALLLLPAAGHASNCAVTSVGKTPLDDLGPGTYQGQQGGLYPDGENQRPPAHDAAGRAIAEAITPINNRVVLISIGMSNATQEFSRFVPLAMSYPGRNPALRVRRLRGGWADRTDRRRSQLALLDHGAPALAAGRRRTRLRYARPG